jgi:predicted transcriptional regulator of viral defense system
MTLPPLSQIALRKPQATLALTSALDRHDLTAEIPALIDIALPLGSRPVKTAFTTIRWHSFDDATFTIGRTTIELTEGIQIGSYTLERTNIDCFRTRHLTGPDAANDALKRWLRQPGSHPSSLLTMAKHFPQAYPVIRNTLQILL